MLDLVPRFIETLVLMTLAVAVAGLMRTRHRRSNPPPSERC